MTGDAGVRVVDLQPQNANAQGFVASGAPAMSWRLGAARPDVIQIAYEIQTSPTSDFRGDLVSSGRIPRSSPIAAPWPGPRLKSRERRWIRVRIWTDDGASDWSAPICVEAGLLAQEDWIAQPISPISNEGSDHFGAAPLVRRTIHLDHPPKRARLYVSALGVHETWINGVRVSDALLEPGWTAYRSRLLYAAHDVTALLQAGSNVIASAVGDGWWRGRLTWMDRRALYGDRTCYLAQLEILTADDSQCCVVTDGDWRGAYGDILSADIYDGSIRDLRRRPYGWRLPDFDDSNWERVVSLARPDGLELSVMPPVRVVERIPVPVRRDADNIVRLDAKQNLTGFVQVTARGSEGARITVRHAEVLDSSGALFTAPLRTAKATDTYVLADSERVVLEPSFTFHGFRYAEIESDANVEIEAAEVQVVSSDLEQIGSFACSEDRLNALFSNVRWSQRGNFIALPTDCPQRDERLGWTGDIQVFAPTACANADARAFLSSWLKDLAIEQRADGNVPSTVPNVIKDFEFEYAGVGWSDAATLTPWAIYVAYGDDQVLKDQFASMRAWVDYGASRLTSEHVWLGDFHLGDWLDPNAPPDQPERGTTDRDFIASSYLSFSARTLAKAATVLGERESAGRYLKLARDVADATWARWKGQALRTQAGCALAIMFEIAPEPETQVVASALAELVEANDGRIGTGFLGTPLVLPALTKGDQLAAAYRLLLNERCPGWLYQVKQGATTMWERWDAIHEDGQIHSGEMAAHSASMTSFNHYAYGAVAAWLYQTVAGIAPFEEEPGYARINFAPRPGGNLRWASATMRSPYGACAIFWSIEADGALSVRLEVPAGARGVFTPPPEWTTEACSLTFGSGVHAFTLPRQDLPGARPS